MADQEYRGHGITETTPQNIALGAGTIHKGLKYTATYEVTEDSTAQEGKTYYERTGSGPEDYTYTKKDVETSGSVTGLYEITGGSWNLNDSIIAATSGGNKLSITPEITPIEVDGANVAVIGLDYKASETATLEVNVVEVTGETLKTMLVGTSGPSDTVAGYDEITPKDFLEAGDYIENFGFVGQTIGGDPIIVLFDYAICTSGIEWDAKAKEAGVLAATFECRAPITSSLKSQAWHVYTKTPVLG